MRFREKEVVAFLKKSSAKNFCPESTVLQTPGGPEQKFFAELFFKKATSCF